MLGYSDYRNFEQVIQKARLACFNSGQKVEDHFVDVTEMVQNHALCNSRDILRNYWPGRRPDGTPGIPGALR